MDVIYSLAVVVLGVAVPIALIVFGFQTVYYLRKGRRIKALIALILASLCGILLNSMVTTTLEAARRTSCMSHLSQLAKALVMYQMGHSNYPASLQSLTNICKAPIVFACPSSGHQAGSSSNLNDWTDYYYVSGLKASDPSHCLQVCCCGSHQNKGGNALFLDGSVEWCNQEQLQALTNNFGITNQAVLSEIKSRVKIIRGTGQIGK